MNTIRVTPRPWRLTFWCASAPELLATGADDPVHASLAVRTGVDCPSNFPSSSAADLSSQLEEVSPKSQICSSQLEKVSQKLPHLAKMSSLCDSFVRDFSTPASVPIENVLDGLDGHREPNLSQVHWVARVTNLLTVLDCCGFVSSEAQPPFRRIAVGGASGVVRQLQWLSSTPSLALPTAASQLTLRDIAHAFLFIVLRLMIVHEGAPNRGPSETSHRDRPADVGVPLRQVVDDLWQLMVDRQRAIELRAPSPSQVKPTSAARHLLHADPATTDAAALSSNLGEPTHPNPPRKPGPLKSPRTFWFCKRSFLLYC
jgi:hypothetical protein